MSNGLFKACDHAARNAIHFWLRNGLGCVVLWHVSIYVKRILKGWRAGISVNPDPPINLGFPSSTDHALKPTDLRSKLDWEVNAMMPTNEYVEMRNGGYYIAGTRVGLDIVAHDFRNGKSADSIFEAYPSIGSLAKVYGAITFILEHPADVDAYLEDQDRRYRELQTRYPLPPDMIERFERAKNEKSVKQA